MHRFGSGKVLIVQRFNSSLVGSSDVYIWSFNFLNHSPQGLRSTLRSSSYYTI